MDMPKQKISNRVKNRKIFNYLAIILAFLVIGTAVKTLAFVSFSKSTYYQDEPIVWSTTEPNNNRFMDQSCGPLIDGVDNDLNLATNSTGGGCSFGADPGSHEVDECGSEEKGFCDRASQFFFNSVAFTVLSGSAPVTGAVDANPPSVPAGFNALPFSSSQIDLSWKASVDYPVNSASTSGVGGYYVYRNGNKVGETATTGFSDKNLSYGVYYYRVAVFDKAGNVSAKSKEIRARTYKFTAGDRVKVVLPVNVRISPTVESTRVGTQFTGNLGTIVSGPKSANGQLWWQINYDNNQSGWSVQFTLEKIGVSRLPGSIGASASQKQ